MIIFEVIFIQNCLQQRYRVQPYCNTQYYIKNINKVLITVKVKNVQRLSFNSELPVLTRLIENDAELSRRKIYIT